MEKVRQIISPGSAVAQCLCLTRDRGATGLSLTGVTGLFLSKTHLWGAQWLSGRVLDSRPRGHRFEPHRHHCVVSLSKNINPSLVLVQPRKRVPL